MLNAVGREIPEEILERTGKEVFQGNNYKDGKAFQKASPKVTPVMRNDHDKMVQNIHLMGFDGKSIINPRQIPIVHEIFTPTQKDIIFAEKVVKEIDSKKALGIGVFTVDGKMIDIAFYDGAKRTIDLAKASGVYKGDL